MSLSLPRKGGGNRLDEPGGRIPPQSPAASFARSRPAPVEAAPAKVNLTLEIHGRRPDGYHELESLVVFARFGDGLTLDPGEPTGLDVGGPFAGAVGASDDNLVLRAARELGRRVDGLKAGRFALLKRLPVASGIGGGSTDAAAALRLLARANAIDPADQRLVEAARATGADVPVCLDPRPRMMGGIGEKLSGPLHLARLPAVLVNPGVPVGTREVFSALGAPPLKGPGPDEIGHAAEAIPYGRDRLFEYLRAHRNDLEAAAITLAPVVADVLEQLRTTQGCELARMSGSGGTCFGLFRTSRAASVAARQIRAARPHWWVRATVLG